MKQTLFLAVAVFLSTVPFLHAKDENGLRVEARKTVVENSDDKSVGYNAKIDRTLAIKLIIKNISIKPFDAGTIDWIMLVERWGIDRVERYKGTSPLPALKIGEELTLTVGESQLGGYKAWDNQDTLKGWKITILHNGKVTTSDDSGSSFERANKSAKEPFKHSSD